MKTSPFSSHLRRQQGATLIVMVLLTMIMLLAVLFVTMNLSMSARRTTTDQTQTIPAQFAAESGMASMQANLKAFEQLMPLAGNTQKELDQLVITNGQVPSQLASRGIDLSYNETITLIKGLCGNSTVNNMADNGITTGVWTYGSNVSIPGVAEVCRFPEAPMSAAQQELFRKFMSANNPALKSIYGSYGITSEADSTTFINAAFNNKTTFKVGDATAEMQGGILPIALLRAEPSGNAITSNNITSYPFYLIFKLADASSVGKNATSARQLVMNNNSGIFAMKMDFKFYGATKAEDKINESFINFAMFVNDAFNSESWLSYNTKITGKAHTNTYWKSIADSYGRNWTVDGDLSSTGCSSLVTVTKADGTTAQDCADSTRTSSFYVSRSGYNPGVVSNPTSMDTTDANYSAYGNRAAYFLYKKGSTVNMQNEFIQMPANANDQSALAQAGGINIGENVTNLTLSVTGTGTTERQNFAITTASGSCTLRVGSYSTVDATGKTIVTEKIEIRNSNGTWSFASRDANVKPCGFKAGATQDTAATYNGVFYTTGSITNLNGGTTATASFMQTTVAAQGSIIVSSNLKHADASKDSALGIYAAGGDVVISANAPSDLRLDAFIMASKGSFRLQNLSTSTPDKGTLTTYGGLIQNTQKGIRIEKSGGAISGYRTDYRYDDRKKVPRGFPTYTRSRTPQDPVPTGAPKLVGLQIIFDDPSSNKSIVTTGFSNNGEIRQVGIQ